MFIDTQEPLALPDSQSNASASLHISYMHCITVNKSLLYPFLSVFMQLFQLVFAGPWLSRWVRGLCLVYSPTLLWSRLFHTPLASTLDFVLLLLSSCPTFCWPRVAHHSVAFGSTPPLLVLTCPPRRCSWLLNNHQAWTALNTASLSRLSVLVLNVT